MSDVAALRPLVTTVASGLLPQNLYGVVAEFSSAAEILAAATKVSAKGYTWWDCYTPHPVHGLDPAMRTGKSWVGLFTLVGGITGLIIGFLLQVIPSVYVYPLITQAKPFYSLPAFVPIIDLLMIIVCTVMTIGGMTTMNLLPRFYHPLFNWEGFKAATRDKYLVVIEANDPRFHEKNTPALLTEIGGKNLLFIGEEE